HPAIRARLLLELLHRVAAQDPDPETGRLAKLRRDGARHRGTRDPGAGCVAHSRLLGGRLQSRDRDGLGRAAIVASAGTGRRPRASPSAASSTGLTASTLPGPPRSSIATTSSPA